MCVWYNIICINNKASIYILYPVTVACYTHATGKLKKVLLQCSKSHSHWKWLLKELYFNYTFLKKTYNRNDFKAKFFVFFTFKSTFISKHSIFKCKICTQRELVSTVNLSHNLQERKKLLSTINSLTLVQ